MNASPLIRPGRWAVVRDEIDGSERPLVLRGRPVAFNYRPLAAAVALGYPGTHVRDTGGEP